MQERTSLYALNRGVVSALGVARVDVKRIAMGAEVQTNWLPRVLGAAMLRPGWAYLGNTRSNAAARMIAFIFATSDTAKLEFSANFMRVWINDALLTRPTVTTAVTNGTFPTDLSGWTDEDESGGTSTWAAPNYMQLVGDGTSRAIRTQAVAVVGANIGVEHALRITIARGPVSLRVGSTSGGDEYVSEATLLTGTHSISFTPSGTFYIQFFSRQIPLVWVSGCTIEAAGVVTLPTPWGASDLANMRTDQSGDVVFVACDGLQQRRIERRGTSPNARSWSVVVYQTNDGPFRLENISATTLAPSATTGNITVTASIALFRSTHVGALFSLTSVGQQVTVNASAANTFTAAVRISGVGNDRAISFTVTGTFVATVTVQRSFDNATWSDTGTTFAAPGNAGLSDGLDNQIVYYRIGVKTGDYTSGTAVCNASAPQGSIRGIVRITDVASSTSASAEVLVSLGGTAATSVWQEGQWSDRRGWPTAVRIHEGRLWWAGKNGIWGSVSDAFDSFDETYPGDAGPINRTIGSGPVDIINWLLSLKGLGIGAQGAEYTARSSSLDEPLTPTNFNVKSSSTQGSGTVEAIKVDQGGYFVDRTGAKVFELTFDVGNYDFRAADVMELVPEIGLPGIVRIAVQRKPDTRLHCVRSDGTVALLVVNKTEDVLAWIPLETDGFVEDVVVLPAITGNLDDQVTYIVRRVINGSTVRFHEKWAQELECRGDQQLCKLADSHVVYSGAPTTVLHAAHLEGEQVVVWADGADIGTDDSARPWTQRYTVTGGVVTPALTTPVSNAVVGLGYRAQFRSMKLGSATQAGSPLNRKKNLGAIGFILANTHTKGIKFGPTLDDVGSMRMDDLPEIEKGTLAGDTVRATYDEEEITFPGTWTTDSRICLQAQAPRPATVLAITFNQTATS